ncbi:exported hypothetical protein [Gammaproteobacteria bacterium]
MLINLAVFSRWSIATLCILFLSNAIFAADVDVVVDTKDDATAPQVTKTTMGAPQINIVSPQYGISHNRFEQYNVGTEGIIISNSSSSETVRGEGIIGSNKKIIKSAKTILFEVTGPGRSELRGATTIAGEQAEFILVNPNGITCDGCDFINMHDVVLRTDRLYSIIEDKINWDKDLDGNISIGKNGTTALGGSLTLSSGKIKVEGAVSAKELLRVEAHSTKDKAPGSGAKNEDEKYTINVSTAALITAGKVYLIATGDGALVRVSASKLFANESDIKPQDIISGNKKALYIEAKEGDISIEEINASQNGDVKIYGKKVDIKNISEAENLIVHGRDIIGDFKLNNVKNVEVIEKRPIQHEMVAKSTMDFNVITPISIDGDFKFIGRNFKNQSTFKAGSITLDLSGDVINDVNGSITTEGQWYSNSKGFTNYQRMDIGKAFEITGDTFVNDNGGSISAGSIEINLVGKREDGNSLYQGSNSILESKEGGIELSASDGGMYFGYKKELTGDGDNKDGFKFIGSQLLSRGRTIHIKSGGDVVFDGTQLLGDLTVEAKGQIKENNLTGSYKNGVHNVKENILKTRIVTKQVDATRIVPKIKTYTTREVIREYDECVRDCWVLGCCGSEHRKIYGDVIHTENVFAEEHYTKDITVEEQYTEEVIHQEPFFQDVSLKTNFAGSKQFITKGDLMFKAVERKFIHSTPTEVEYLEFFSPIKLDYDDNVRYHFEVSTIKNYDDAVH